MAKKIFTIAVSAFFCLLALQANAAQSDAVLVKVTIAHSLSVNITEDNLSLGSVATGATAVSTTPVIVTNNGTGISESYSLSLTNPAGWTASQTNAGAETYVLNAGFSNAVSGISWDNADHALSTTSQAATDVKFAGDQTGSQVPYNAVRKLWFQFKAPTVTTVNAEQNIIITITAQAS